ncbi:hypothetical protein [Halovenus sp. HT40]|uniref:hypothetical protein n=1 Tax=Halovenus sp. HT40 TaxID=3126691 RepID=UPI00300ECB44
MTQIQQLQGKIVDELGVMEDDIHVTRDEDTMTFYLPPNKLEDAENTLDRELEMLEEHDHKYLVKADIQ